MFWVKIAIQVALLWLKEKLTSDAEKKEARKEAIKDVRKGIKNRDRSAVARAIDRLR
jgi:hypothetical protein